MDKETSFAELAHAEVILRSERRLDRLTTAALVAAVVLALLLMLDGLLPFWVPTHHSVWPVVLGSGAAGAFATALRRLLGRSPETKRRQ